MTNLYYEDTLKAFKALNIHLIKYDSSPYGMPFYIEVDLNKAIKPKDRGALVLDLGNYIYRTFGIAYEMVPEFRGRGAKTTLRWFVSWERSADIVESLKKHYKKEHVKEAKYVPLEFRAMYLQKGAK